MGNKQADIIVYVMSDSAGDTGELVVRAAMAQFHPLTFDIRRQPFVTTIEQASHVVEMALAHNAIILYTLVVPELREQFSTLATQSGVMAIDLMGPLVASLSQKTGQAPRYVPGLNHMLDANYFRKVEAVEFAVKYDDMRDTSGILKADIVLTGVSRTSKTPLSMYLAHKGYKVANVPLMPELAPPVELTQIPKEKIVGLIIDVHSLNIIRQERLKALGLPDTSAYANTERIEQELVYAKQIMHNLQCEIINVSHRAIEETASLILDRIAHNNE